MFNQESEDLITNSMLAPTLVTEKIQFTKAGLNSSKEKDARPLPCHVTIALKWRLSIHAP